jgi:hypothetical protein
MTMKLVYLGLCILGTVLPLAWFIPFLREHGASPGAFLAQLFANPVGGFFGMDVLVSSLVLWVLVFVEGRRAGMRHLWAPIAANLPLVSRSGCRCSSTCARGGSSAHPDLRDSDEVRLSRETLLLSRSARLSHGVCSNACRGPRPLNGALIRVRGGRASIPGSGSYDGAS